MKDLLGSDNEQLVPIAKAAKMLGVTIDAVRSMNDNGLLQAVKLKKVKGTTKPYGVFFPLHEIAVLAELRHEKVTLGQAAKLATRAIVVAKATERKLDDLFRLLGLKRKTLGLEPSELVGLYARAEDIIAMQVPLTLEEIEDWSATLYGMDESYLGLVAKEIGTDEPWQVYFVLASKLVFDAARCTAESDQGDQTVKHAKDTRDHLRRVVFTYCHLRYGKEETKKIFTGSISEQLLEIIRPTQY